MYLLWPMAHLTYCWWLHGHYALFSLNTTARRYIAINVIILHALFIYGL
uniref:TLC domain-containing protein n=1 Tax=Picea sitchensis TaxID=3332 RepID=B8LRL2_PICSI|nr:unknown [Picea sitchensis]